MQDGLQCIHSTKVDTCMVRLVEVGLGFGVSDPLFRQYDLVYNHFDYFSPSNWTLVHYELNDATVGISCSDGF